MKKILTVFPAFHSKNYQLYFLGQLISMTGTWLQSVAQGWLVLQMTNSAFLVGLVSALTMFPVLVLSLWGGVIVDRLQTRKVMIVTQTIYMILALILGLLTISHNVNFIEIAVLAFLMGIVSSVDAPARQAFVSELVEKEYLSSAIALNSGLFNAARIVGPAMAGLLIALIGTGGAFILNGISFIAVIIALLLMQLKDQLPQIHSSSLRAIKEGVSYAFGHPLIGTYLIYTGMVAIFGWSNITIMPVIVQDVFGLGAAQLGTFYSAAGVGAIIGILIVSALSKKFKPSGFIYSGCIIFSVFLLIFSLVKVYPLALIFLILSGVGITMQMSMINFRIQHSAEAHIRGRVMSIFTLMTMGMGPFGSLEVGFIAQHFGVQNALRVGAIALLLFGSFVFWKSSAKESNYKD